VVAGSHRLVAANASEVCDPQGWSVTICLQQRVDGVGGAHGLLPGRAFQPQLRREAQRCSGTQQGALCQSVG